MCSVHSYNSYEGTNSIRSVKWLHNIINLLEQTDDKTKIYDESKHYLKYAVNKSRIRYTHGQATHIGKHRFIFTQDPTEVNKMKYSVWAYFLFCYIVTSFAGDNLKPFQVGLKKALKCRLIHDAGKTDTQVGYKVNCTNISLTSIPTCDMMPVNCSMVVELSLNDNQIGILPPNGFIQFGNLQKLDLSGNPVEKFQNNSFQGLSNLESLVTSYVKCRNNMWVKFELDTFAPLRAIRSLTMAYVPLSLLNLFQCFCSIGHEMETVYLRGTTHLYQMIILDGSNTKCFKKLQLKSLTLDENIIGVIKASAVMNFGQKLKHISLKGNQIVWQPGEIILIGAFYSLAYVDFSCQNSKSCTDEYPWSKWLPKVPQPFENNAEDSDGSIFPDGNGIDIYLLPKLRSLYMHHTVLHIYFSAVCWMNNTIINIDVSYSSKIYIMSKISCLYHLKRLNLRGIKLLRLTMESFQEMPSLEILMLGSSVVPDSIFHLPQAPVIFKNNKNLKFLDLSNLQLKRVHKNIFMNLSKLEVLILSHNQLTNVRGLLVNLSSLNHVDLSFNRFKAIPLLTILVLDKLTFNVSKKVFLRLDNNPYFCTCSDMYGLQIVLRSRVIIKDSHVSNGSLRCILNNSRDMSFKQALKALETECRKLDKVSIAFLTFVYPFSLSVMAILAFCFRYRWRIQYFWLAGLQFVKTNEELNKDTNKKFDAFVAHSSHDEEWVRTNLIKKLESGSRPLKLCTHDRCFLPGEYIADNIIAAISQSEKTILVVTDKYLKSGWCDYESRAAQAHHLGNAKGIVAIVFPKVHSKVKKNSALRNLLDCVTYLEWSPDKKKEMLFWIKLRRALER